MNKKRERALVEGRKTYSGNPCRKCGSLIRYARTDACQACMKVHGQKARDRIRAVYESGKAAREA